MASAVVTCSCVAVSIVSVDIFVPYCALALVIFSLLVWDGRDCSDSSNRTEGIKTIHCLQLFLLLGEFFRPNSIQLFFHIGNWGRAFYNRGVGKAHSLQSLAHCERGGLTHIHCLNSIRAA